MAQQSRFRILQKPVDCYGCSLETEGKAFSEPEGFCTNGVLGIGESLGYNEAVDGYPFRPQAQAGGVLERVFIKIGVPRRQFGLWNLTGCRPPDDSLQGRESAIQHCRVHFNRVIQRMKPKVLLALGAFPLRSLTKLGGKKLNLEYLRGYPLWSEEFGLYVLPTYHPSLIARGAWNLFPVLCRDIKRALRIAKGLPVENLEYIENGTEEHMRIMLEELRDCPDLPLSEDLEDDSLIRKANKIPGAPEITQINVSTKMGTGLVVLPSQENLQTLRQMNALSNPKIGQNFFLYDAVLLEKHYGHTINGTIEDVMWMFHHLYPDLPMKKSKKDEDDENGAGDDAKEIASIANLQYIASFADFPFPWKHESGPRPGFYGCCDVDAPLRAYWWLRDEMEALGVLEGYYAFVAELMPCLRNMRVRGIPINKEKLLALHKRLTGEIEVENAKIQVIVPDHVRANDPKHGYKKIPADTTGMVMRAFIVRSNPAMKCKCFRVRKPRKDDQNCFSFVEAMESDYAVWEEKADGRRVLRAPDDDCRICGGKGAYAVDEHKEDRWCKLLPFNVRSSDQMWEYARWRKYRVPRNAQNEYAMDTETIAKLAKSTNDPLYVTTDRIRKLGKIDSTYAVGWLRESDENSRVHPQVGFFPSTGQFSSRAPNGQNVPNVDKQGQLAIDFREGIEAPDGFVLMEWDYKSFHAQTLGIEAGCEAYVRLARIDIHSYLAVHLLKLDGRDECLGWTDAELKDWLKWHRKNYFLKNGDSFEKLRNGKAKPAILGYGFGLQGPRMYRMNMDSFDNEREATGVIVMLDSIFSECKEYRDTMPLRAKRGVYITPDGPRLVKRLDGEEETNIIITRYGCPRWFWDIKRYNPKTRKMEHGDDWERAIAYAPANNAFCHIKLAMKRLEDSGANAKYGLINQIHDALLALVRKPDVEEADYQVRKVMEAPSELMLLPWDGNKGLSVEVDAKTGPNWAHMKGFERITI